MSGLSASEVDAAVKRAQKLLADKPVVLDFAVVGSATYLPEPNDVDFVVLVKGNPVNAKAIFFGAGWQTCDKGQYSIPGEDNLWTAVRLGDINLMLTNSQGWYDGYTMATELCKALKLKEKWRRVRVCRIVRDGWNAEMLDDLPEANPEPEVGS